MKQNLIIGVIGLGYVGTPLALSLGRFFKVVGYDLNKKRILELKNKKDITNETNLSEFIKAKKIFFTNKLKDLKDCNVFIITVPSPVTNTNKPDFYYLKNRSIFLDIKIIIKTFIVIFFRKDIKH